MIKTNTSLNPSTPFWRWSRPGWIGIELGLSSVRMAQLSRIGNSWKLTASWTENACKLDSSPEAQAADKPENFGLTRDRVTPTQTILAKLLSNTDCAKYIFRGNSAAIALNDGLIEYRELDFPQCDEEELQRQIHNELALEHGLSSNECLSQSWALATLKRSKNPHQSVATLSTTREFTNYLGHQLIRYGLEPRIFDGLPFALARAATIFRGAIDEPLLMVDMGDACATLTLVVDQQPVLTRVLPHHGFGELVKSIANDLELRDDEARMLFAHFAGESAAMATDRHELSRMIAPHQSRFLKRLGDEINRTLQYLRYSKPQFQPQSLILSGSGTMLVDVAGQVEKITGLSTDTWSVNAMECWTPGLPISTYAVAASLSALAWEQH